jgi:hypothetical protein
MITSQKTRCAGLRHRQIEEDRMTDKRTDDSRRSLAPFDYQRMLYRRAHIAARMHPLETPRRRGRPLRFVMRTENVPIPRSRKPQQRSLR